MAYILSTKPFPRTHINWSIAPPSLVGCQPLIYGEDPTTTFEYVSRTVGALNTFTPNTFGSTTWQSYGVNMNGGGAAGARAVEMRLSVLTALDPHRRTVAWAQRFLGMGSNDSTALFNGTFSAGRFTVEAPFEDADHVTDFEEDVTCRECLDWLYENRMAEYQRYLADMDEEEIIMLVMH